MWEMIKEETFISGIKTKVKNKCDYTKVLFCLSAFQVLHCVTLETPAEWEVFRSSLCDSDKLSCFLNYVYKDSYTESHTQSHPFDLTWRNMLTSAVL